MLKDVALRNAKPTAKPRKLSDGGGLHVLIQPTGGKLWRLAYRFAGKQKTLALGVYPMVSLEEARKRREEAKKLLAHSIDPSAQRKTNKHAAKDSSFRAVAEEVIAKLEREGRAKATLDKTGWLLNFAYPTFGGRRVAEISARDLLALLRQIEGRGRYETARRLRSTCGMVFRYAIATGRAERDPSMDLRGALTAPPVNHRATIVDPKSIGALLRAIDSFDGQPPTSAALRLSEMGRWNPDAIEPQLAHQEANAVRRAYTHGADYWSERVLMMQGWADYLDGLKEGGKVVPLIKANVG